MAQLYPNYPPGSSQAYTRNNAASGVSTLCHFHYDPKLIDAGNYEFKTQILCINAFLWLQQLYPGIEYANSQSLSKAQVQGFQGGNFNFNLGQQISKASAVG